jgi:beta-glucosidase-like glycosyl hydrolase
MWINGEWLGGDYSLLTNIVRNEWGYNGMITTDNAGQGGGYKWMSPSKMIYAGGDMVLANPAMKLDSSIKTSEEGISAMKTATKHILYTVASAYLNRLEATRVGENTFIPIYIVINIVLFGGMAGCLIAEGVSLALYFGKRKKITQSETQGTSETQGMPETQGTSETQGMQETQGTSETQQQTNDL